MTDFDAEGNLIRKPPATASELEQPIRANRSTRRRGYGRQTMKAIKATDFPQRKPPQPTSGKQEQEWTADGKAIWSDTYGIGVAKSEKEAQIIAAAHNASITAEREKLPVIEAELKRLGEIETLYLQQLEEIQQLREQLATAQQPLVDALLDALSNTLGWRRKAGEALAKVKEGKMNVTFLTTINLNEYVAKECQSLIDALEEVRKVTDDPRLGTINYMEGSHIYADMNNATKLIDAALAQWKEKNK